MRQKSRPLKQGYIFTSKDVREELCGTSLAFRSDFIQESELPVLAFCELVIRPRGVNLVVERPQVDSFFLRARLDHPSPLKVANPFVFATSLLHPYPIYAVSPMIDDPKIRPA